MDHIDLSSFDDAILHFIDPQLQATQLQFQEGRSDDRSLNSVGASAPSFALTLVAPLVQRLPTLFLWSMQSLYPKLVKTAFWNRCLCGLL